MKHLNVTDIAIIAHNMNAALCSAMGDDSQPSWEDLPDNLKDSAVDGVQFHINNREATPADSHENWMKHKLDDGWVYGEEKDVEAKTHPCLVPYEELPEAQRAKDYIFKATVENMLNVVHGTVA